MGEVERRRGYGWNRVLIESGRILDPEFNDAVVLLSGAQIEMLRNVSQYLNRLGTYASEYNPGYYLVPTDEDFDDILEIVADLEETLMGNENVIFGYNKSFFNIRTHTVSGDGDEHLFSEIVPEGEVWRVEGAMARNDDTVLTKVQIYAYMATGPVMIREQLAPVAGESTLWDGMATLWEGSKMWAKFTGCLDGDGIRFSVRGYVMQVP